jgi:drug/metabolite transporter (DMT)-like permease
MDAHVFALVLLAAACHAGWNAVIKLGAEPFTATALIALAAGIVAAPFVPVFGLPPLTAWPWLAASVILHLGYYVGLIEAYRAGDMGQVYPIARGSAPLMTAVASVLLVGERIAPAGWAGIVLLALGIFLLSLRGGRDIARLDRRAVGFALFTACTICGYSVVDGVGARAAGSAHAYAAMLFVCDGIAMGALAWARRRGPIAHALAQHWRAAFAGGALSFLAYWIAIWAMTVAPIPLVAALRETSVLFGAAIAVVLLKEPLRPMRIGAAALIVAGLALIRIA